MSLAQQNSFLISWPRPPKHSQPHFILSYAQCLQSTERKPGLPDVHGPLTTGGQVPCNGGWEVAPTGVLQALEEVVWSQRSVYTFLGNSQT